MMTKTAEKYLDPQLWHACAGGMVQMPPVNSKVFYFPQGHAEHALGHAPPDIGNPQNTPPLILCRLAAIKYLADPDTDEVFAKITLLPLKPHGLGDLEDDGLPDLDGAAEGGFDKAATSFAKTLTQSDANNGGGFSVPRYCAETIFPRLDYSAEPPVQTVIAKDVQGQVWKFRHIYRGTPRRHLLTTGWSNFVNQKKLVAGDSIVFLRAQNGDLCVGIRRAKRGGFGSGPEFGPGQIHSGAGPFGGYPMFNIREGGDIGGKVAAESVVKAAGLASSGRTFEVVYYPRAGTPEFFVKASSVSRSMRIQWCSGMRFKMPFETEDSSRISWFMGTISAVQVSDPIRWPNSPWRLLQVAWDEPDLLQNVKRVSPWLVELVSTIPSIHLSPFSPPRKKLRTPFTPDFSLTEEQQQHLSCFPSNAPLCYFPDRIALPAGIQGARHAQYYDGLRKFHSSGLFGNGPHLHLDNYRHFPPLESGTNYSSSDNISCLLTMATPANPFKETVEEKSSGPGGSEPSSSSQILLFGQVIVADRQRSETSVSGPPESSSEEDSFPVRRGKDSKIGGHGNVSMVAATS